jgi:hypothetical protein
MRMLVVGPLLEGLFGGIETGGGREIVFSAGSWTAAHEALRTSITSFVEGCVEWVSPKKKMFGIGAIQSTSSVAL